MIKMTIGLVKISCVNDRLIPLGLACLQAYLKANDVEVKVFNFRTEVYSLPKVASDPLIQLEPPTFIMNHQDFPLLVPIVDKIMNGSEINLNKGIFPDIIKDFSQRLKEEPSITQTRFENVIEYVKTIIPKLQSTCDSIGFSLNYLNIPETVIASCFIKRFTPEIKILWGGPTITQSKEIFKLLLKKDICDGLVVGEGEAPLLEFAQGKELGSIPGIMTIKNSSEFIYSSGIQLDLDSLPTPDYTDIPLDTYFQIASVYRSRGCTHRCKFCAEWKLFGRRFRVRSVSNVIQDIQTIINTVNPEFIIFGESLINDDLLYFEQLCDALIKKQFNISFGTHFRANITPELAKKAYLAGFNDAWVGFEAFSDKDLKEMNKGTSVNQNITTIKNLTQAGINVIAMLVVGFSNLEEEEKNCSNIVDTINYFSKERVIKSEGISVPISIQWRPAPMFIVPSSFDYNEKKSSADIWSWKCTDVSYDNRAEITQLEHELSEIPYEFRRPITDMTVGLLMKRIQEADRISNFAIGGLMKHIVDYLMSSRRKGRKLRKQNRIGVNAQRYGQEVVKNLNQP